MGYANEMRIGPVLLHVIKGIVLDNDRAEEEWIRGVRENPTRLQSQSGLYVGPLKLPKNGWDFIKPFLNIGNSYELQFQMGERRMFEIVVEDRCDHHVHVDLPEAIITTMIGKPALELTSKESAEILGWKDETKIVNRCKTNDKDYLVVEI